MSGPTSARRSTLDAVLLSDELALNIALQHACNTRGACAAFFVFGEVCSAWRAASRLADERLADWYTNTWTVRQVSKAGTAGVALRVKGCPYDWVVNLIPRCETRYNEVADEEVATRTAVTVGAQLVVPSPETLPDNWSRRAEFQLTLHHATDASRARSKYFRIRFGKRRTAWPEAPEIPYTSNAGAGCGLLSLGLADELHESGFVRGDSMTVSLRVRTHPGRLRCVDMRASTEAVIRAHQMSVTSSIAQAVAAAASMNAAAADAAVVSATQAVQEVAALSTRMLRSGRNIVGGLVHPVVRPDGLSDLLKHVRPDDFCRIFFCDVCKADVAVTQLHRCARGCNFDICSSCIDPATMRVVDHLTIGWAGGERPLHTHGTGFAIDERARPTRCVVVAADAPYVPSSAPDVAPSLDAQASAISELFAI